MSSQIFITGISGFLASHIALVLLKSGATITGSVRSLKKSEHIRAVLETHGANTQNLRFVELDLLRDDGWDEAVSGHDYLIHTASPFVSKMPADANELVRPAVDGVVRALQAGLKAKVKRIVLTSSLAAMAFGHEGAKIRSVNDSDWTNPEGPGVNAYVLSKTLAERKAWEIVEEAGCPEILSAVNPGFMMGPVLEKDIGTSGALILKMLTGGFPGAPHIYFSCVDVRDAANLHIAAMTDSRAAGQRLLMAGPPVRLADLAKGLASDFPAYKRKLPTRQLPDFMIRLVALFDGDAKTAITLLGQVHHCDSSKAVALLGRELISTREAAREMANTIINLGLA